MNANKVISGFTLVELLLVLFILSSLSLVVVDFVENEDSQIRFEETRKKLVQIRRAILGEERPVYNGQVLLSGYVADNGRVPSTVEDLINRPSNLDDFGMKSPVFDPTPDSEGFNDGVVSGGSAEVILNEVHNRLQKGYRGHSYLQIPPATSNAGREFIDGWNNGSVGAANYGWEVIEAAVSPSPAVSEVPLTFTSFGLENIKDSTLAASIVIPEYEQDLSAEIYFDEWSVDLDGWEITLQNNTGLDIDIPTGFCAKVSLLHYNNSDTATQKWKRVTSECLSGTVGVGPTFGSCFDGDGDGDVNGVNCPNKTTNEVKVSFNKTEFSSSFPLTRLPMGEHLAVLIMDNNVTQHDGEHLCKFVMPVVPPATTLNCESISSTALNAKVISSKLIFYPNTATRPTAELIIK